MKQLILSFIVAGIPFLTCAQSDVEIKLNAAGLMFLQVQGGVELVPNDNMGVGLMLSGVSRSFTITTTVNGISDESEWKSRTLSAIPYYRYYFSPKHGGDQFFLEAYYKYRHRTWLDRELNGEATDGTITTSNTDVIQNIHAAGLGLGSKWIAKSGIYGEVLVGFGRTFSREFSFSNENVQRYYDNSGDSIDTSVFGIDLRFALSIGYRFGHQG